MNNKKNAWFSAIAVLTAVMVFAPYLPAQESAAKGSLNGVVVDSTGSSIVDAQETLIGPEGNRITTTNGSGVFIFQDLIPGTYKVKSEYKGFKATEVSGVVINVGAVATIRIQMEPGTVTQTVEVVSAAVTVDTTSTAVATNISDDFYEKLPVQRGVASLFYLAPGVVNGGGTGASNPSIGGATGLENLYIADGVSITDTAFGGLGVFSRVYGSVGTGINLTFIKEVQIKTGSIQPQYGGATGGVVQIVTKSGSHDYHGAISGYWQPQQFEAQRENADNFGLANPFGSVVHNAAWDVSGEIGGSVPRFRDKLFFFGSFDPTKDQRYELSPPLTGNFAFGTLQGSQLFLNYAAKLTYKINDKNTIESSVFGDPETSSFFPWTRLREGVAGFPNDTNFSKLDFGNRDLVARYNGTLSASWILNMDVTWQHNKFTETGFNNTLSEITDQTQTLVGPPGGQGIAPNVQAGEFMPVGKGFTENTEDDSYGVHIGTTKIFNFWGQHSLDIGYAYTRPFYKGVRTNSGPAITPPDLNQDGNVDSVQCTGVGGCPWSGTFSNYNWTLNTVPGCPTGGGGTPAVCALMTVPGFTAQQPVALELFRGEFNVSADGNKHFTTTGRNHSAYVNDSWTVNKYVTLNAGIRWQTEKLIGQNTKYTFTDNWSPAVGVTVDPIGDRKNKFWFSFGRYNYNLPLDLAERSLTNETDLFSLALVPDFTVNANGDRVVALNSFGTVTPTVDAAHTLNLANGSPFGIVFGSLESLESIHTGTRLTYEDEYVMGMEHEFSRGLILTARYMHRSLRRIVEDTGGIAPEAANAGIPQQFSITNPSKNLDIFTNPIQTDFASGALISFNGANAFPAGTTIPADCLAAGAPTSGPIPTTFVPFFNFPTNSFGNPIKDGQGNNAACFQANGLGVNGQTAGSVTPDGIPDGFADPVHKYWAVVFEVNKSFSRNWQLRANYTISKVFGNFEGAFRNDNGQSDPGISSLFDFTTGNFNQLGGQFTPGLLNEDRQQVATGYFSYVFDHGMLKNLTMGTGAHVLTGTPITELGAHPVYLNSGEIPIGARGAEGRTPTTGSVDLHADYVKRLTERLNLRFGVDMFNLTNVKRVNFFNQNVDLKFGVANADFLKPTNVAQLGDAIQSPFNARMFFRLEF